MGETMHVIIIMTFIKVKLTRNASEITTGATTDDLPLTVLVSKVMTAAATLA